MNPATYTNGVLKTRLDLENFSGLGAEAVRQDFHATVYLTGLETILTEAAQAQLDAKATRSSPDGQSGRLLQCHQAPRPGPVVERLGHPTLDRAVDRVVSDLSDLRASAAPSAPSENFCQSEVIAKF